jgi:hypothetical protein
MKHGNTFLKKNHELSDLLREFRSASDDSGDEGGRTSPLPLGFKQGESYTTIPKIRKLPLIPREDGYEDTFEEALHADDRPYGRFYFDKFLERKRLLEGDKNNRMVMEMAGAMGKSPLEIYEEGDIERQLIAREKEKVQLHADAKRIYVDVNEKKKQRELLVEDKAKIEHDQDVFVANEYFSDLVRVGRFLVDGRLIVGVPGSDVMGIIPVMDIVLDMTILLDDVASDTLMANERIKLVIEERDNDAYEDDYTTQELLTKVGLKETQLVLSFTVITLFKHFLDLEGVNKNVYTCLRLNNLYLKYANTYIKDINVLLDDGDGDGDGDDDRDVEIKSEKGKNTTFINIAEVDSDEQDSENYGGESIDGVVRIEWKLLKGLQCVILHKLEEYYDEDGVEELVRYGAQAAYNNHPNTSGRKYVDMVLEYIYSKDEALVAENLKKFHIFSSGKNGHPSEVMKILSAVLFKYDNGNKLAVKLLLQSHFAWQYFHHRSTPGLALDWSLQQEKKDRDAKIRETIPYSQQRDALNELLINLKGPLANYFISIMRICNADLVPTAIGTRSVFKFPRSIVEVMEDDGVDEGERGAVQFDQMSSLFKNYNVLDFIKNDHFKEYYLTGKTIFRFNSTGVGGGNQKKSVKKSMDNETPINLVNKRIPNSYAMQLYPILIMHYIFESYYKFVEFYSTMLTQQLSDVTQAIALINEKIIDISRERWGDRRGDDHPFYSQKKAFTSKPINSGIIELKAEVVHFMNQAYCMIKKYCDIGALELEDFQGDSAYHVGLTSDYASLVAALIAENGLNFQKTYKSIASQRYTQMHTANVLNRLKLYTYKKRPNGVVIGIRQKRPLPMTMQSIL